MNNRAIEFLNEAHGLLEYGHIDQAQLLVRLAMTEVQELLAWIAALEAQRGDGRGVLIVSAQRMTPAKLTESRRAALTTAPH